MKKTLITRLKNLDQYNRDEHTILWQDSAPSRWQGVYGELALKDNAIYITGSKLLIGEISEINKGKSFLLNNVKEVACENDEFLQIDAVYPELISRVKANFQPFIHPLELDLNEIIKEINAKAFVSYYLIYGYAKYNSLKNSLTFNDRVVIVNEDGSLENIKKHTLSDLEEFAKHLYISTNVVGLTIDEMLKLNQAISRDSNKSNNVTRLKDIDSKLKQEGIYKFNSFFAYHDTLYNKKVYLSTSNNQENMSSPRVKKINLNGAGLYKVSHGSFKAKKKKHAIEALKQNNWITIHENTGKNRPYKFKNELKKGDYVYITIGGNELIGIAKIISNKCEYIPRDIINEDGWLFREIEMITEPIKKGSIQLDDTRAIYPSGNTAFFKIKSKDLQEVNKLLFIPYFNVEFFDGENTISTPSYINTNYMDMPLNQILFGPPGTGKTYHTINKALSIIEDLAEEDLKKETRTDLTDRFDELLINDWENPTGQIAFVTFHQSMTYEDFIEGIKPVVTPKNKVIYDTLPGIFKNMCTLAKENWLNANSDSQDELSFEDAFSSLKENWEENRDMKFPMKTEGKDYTIIGFTKSSIQFKKASGSIDHTLSISTLRDYFYGRRKVKTTGVGIYYPALLNKLKSYQPTEFEVKEEKKYVLVIDEINRGNVSQIFGELITLIEEDKRLGNNEALEVTLPYSKESFGVPPNLYIIGTMNTADRSVEALDTALRRRFSFEEMPPNYSLTQLDYTIYNYKASKLLKTINRRIEKLLDKDHAIGHSYFIVEEGKNEAKEVIKAFYKNIIPLLQEYFFGDFGKIGLVLGKGFVNKMEWVKNTEAFADFDHESCSDFEERDVYEIIDYRNSNHNYKIDNVAMSFDKAIQLLMKDSIA